MDPAAIPVSVVLRTPMEPCSRRCRNSPVDGTGMEEEDCPNAKRGAAAKAAAGLPDELILEILYRVPARSIHRFKCVSKLWRDLIADPLHRKRLPQTLQGFFFFSNGAARARRRLRFVSLPGTSAPLVDPSYSFLTKQLAGLDHVNLLGSCNGLILFQHRSNSNPDGTPSYTVCNPATEQWVDVPSPSLDSYLGSRIYLVFDPAASPHFYLLHIGHKNIPVARVEARAYSSETRVWGDWVSDGFVNVGGRLAFRSCNSTIANGMLHFIVTDWQRRKNADMIIAMGREGKPRIIQSPGDDNKGPSALFVAQFQGRLHCMRRYAGTQSELSVWVLEEYDAGQWLLKHRVNLPGLFGRMHGLFSFEYSVVSIHPDRDLIFFMQHCGSKGNLGMRWKLISYDMRTEEVRVLHNFGHSHSYCSLTPYIPYFS